MPRQPGATGDPATASKLNEAEIQNEQFWWDRPNGSCICTSLLGLRDKAGDMMSKEGDPDAYERVADQLGYDTVGVPASDEDDLKFSEYRQSGDLGLLSERRWERNRAGEAREGERDLLVCRQCRRGR